MKQKAKCISVGMLSAMAAACATGSGTDDCAAGDTVVVTAAPGRLIADPECITVNRGSSFSLQVPDGLAAGSVRTRPDSRRNPEAGWLARSNDKGRDVLIEVPADAASKEFKYEIEVDEIGMLDPRVRVR